MRHYKNMVRHKDITTYRLNQPRGNSVIVYAKYSFINAQKKECTTPPLPLSDLSIRVRAQGIGQHFPKFGSKASNPKVVAVGYDWPFLIEMAKLWYQLSFLN